MSEIPEIPEPPTFTMEPVPGRPGVVRPVLSRPIQPWIGDPPKECPECAELGHTSCWEAAYRAGREDAARDLRTAVRLIGTECENFRSGTCVDSGRTPDARYTADRWCDHCILREALAGDGVQPTEEQRAREEDQKRDEKGRL